MILLHVSDIHCSYQRLEEVLSREQFDIVAISGDFECYIAIELLKPYVDKVVAIPGNMDDYHVDRLLSELGININCKIVNKGGYSFLGISGRRFKDNLNKAIQVIKDSEDKIDIILSHFPPHGTNVDRALRFIHAGSKGLRKLIEEYKPKLVLCGHIHESPGVDRIGETLIVNAGPIGIKGTYAKIDLESLNVEMLSL